jgi:hypothetical protein
LPTFQKNLDAMFSQLRKDPILQQQVKSGKKLTFVDLGSGDGRVVFRAAKEGMFHRCIGYEINPMLHLFAQLKRLVLGPATWLSTDFALRDIWKTDLRKANVVAVVSTVVTCFNCKLYLGIHTHPFALVLRIAHKSMALGL